MSKFYPLSVANVRNETRDTIAVTFDVPAELQQQFRFQQGQHLTLRAHIDAEDVRRSYSICSAVQDGTLRVAIKRTPGGANRAQQAVMVWSEVPVPVIARPRGLALVPRASPWSSSARSPAR